jgi:hypothetical protein
MLLTAAAQQQLSAVCLSACVLTMAWLFLQAILALKERQGSSLIAIKKYIGEKHKVGQVMYVLQPGIPAAA